jgi:hypothetical protein
LFLPLSMALLVGSFMIKRKATTPSTAASEPAPQSAI